MVEGGRGRSQTCPACGMGKQVLLAASCCLGEGEGKRREEKFKAGKGKAHRRERQTQSFSCLPVMSVQSLSLSLPTAACPSCPVPVSFLPSFFIFHAQQRNAQMKPTIYHKNNVAQVISSNFCLCCKTKIKIKMSKSQMQCT